MEGQAVIVIDTNVLVNLATPVVDRRDSPPSGADPLKAVLSTYDVHVPSAVLGEITAIAAGDDLFETAAEAVLSAAHWMTDHDGDEYVVDPLDQALDEGESQCIALANDLDADMFVTDEFNSFKFQLISFGLDDRNALYTTPHLVCVMADHGIIDDRYVDHALSYYVETKHWDRGFVDILRTQYLSSD